ncbi:TIGR04219 family outer membrane beta-barrel protein [Dasania sp. GY-MA-18]|uniref:TIGR04219 family outer membrane beta-barrel protein n=1 Tax=Dasania phycosphaerae TaxID=2950436 RepID=A0A9J6RS14_9GAMM|nr:MULTISPECIES: TIGR04219 family outer membrane beta-barrel protein [Dasania]MCR8924390.1 TIGR04219 family outer membrane beta-barrel protein [Dasania sp. GY-MA-18]MCZ0867065.1 TIGR04219 family outer membrane beta-barrel protein [Dasania phycosphaerae]MCZ0870517.1 TIGR04219 family outer membrane beta-barrel protein [Dasania phycosphaerae]
MKKTTLAGAIALSLLSTAATADTLGFRVGANSWQQDFSGDIQSGDAGDIVDMQDTLGFDDESNNNFYVAIEHPIPLIPNVMLARTEMEINASSDASFNFDGVDYTADIKATADLSHTDATLYYEILDNWVSLDIGFTVRAFDEGFSISGTAGGTTESSEFDVDVVLPMLYVGAKFELPLSGLYVRASGNGISYDGDSVLDYQAAIGYEHSIGLGIEAGFRSFEIEYEDDDENADLTIDGAFLGVFYHF